LGDPVGQLARCLDRCLSAIPDQSSRDAAGESFLSVPLEHVDQLGFLGGCQPIRRTGSVFGIHAHVQRPIGLKTEPTPGGV